ncbi:MAG: DUF4129 domain-containing protein [Thermoplasmatota archaeon]
MEHLKRHTLLTIAIVTVFIGCWLIGNVIYLLPRATERTAHTEFGIEEEGTGDVRSGFTLDRDAWRLIYFSIIIFLVSVMIVSYFQNGTKRGTILQGLGILIIISITMIYLFSAEMIASLSLPDGLFSGISLGGGVFDTLSKNMGLMILGLLSSSFFLVFTAIKLKDMLISDVSHDEEDEFEGDLSSTVDEAIRSLYQGKDVKSTVIRCYQNMCYILEDEGVSNDEFMTPRELKSKTVQELAVSDVTISSLTELFEKGRYSFHELDKEDRQKAINNLEYLKSELDGGSA